MMIKVVGIKFSPNSRIYYFSPGNLKIFKEDGVLVETERGLQFGYAFTDIIEVSEENVFLPVKNIIRIATKEDYKIHEKNSKESLKALNYAKYLVNKMNINMKIFEASYTFDRKKLIFKFIADERVDFRDLAKQLASKYKTRIELRQIGIRDKAKEIGGLGPCGRPLCCKLFLTNFESVSINMAKNQGIALNPTKINGSCGRLLCCLGYEDFIYSEYKRNLPKLGDSVIYDNKSAKVVELDVLNKAYKIKFDDNDNIITIRQDDNESNK